MPARGTGKYGPDVIVGSPEYWKLWRQDNKERQKLAMAKYQYKQKQLMLAAELAKADGIPVEQALLEVKGAISNLSTLKRVLQADGRLPQRGDVEETVQVVNEPPNPFITEQAQRFDLTYDEALEVMDVVENPAKWDDALAAKRDANRVKKGE